MNRRVLFVDHAGELGGAELSLLSITRKLPLSCHVLLLSDGPFADELRNAGVSVEVISGNSGLHAIRRDSRLRSMFLSIPSVFSIVRNIAKKSRQYDIIYANTQKSFVVAALASLISRRPVIWHLRDILNDEHFSIYTRKAVIFLANLRASKVIANSRATEKAFHDAGGSKNKTKVIYNAIDFEPFLTTTMNKALKIRGVFSSKNKVLVGIFGRLAEWKGQHILIEAMKELAGVQAIIVGGCLFGEEEYERRLIQQVQQYGLQDRVHFLGFRTDIPALMKAMDIIVHASISPEPFGRVIVEAMLSERPVIASRAGGVLEIIEHNKTGLLVTPGHPLELAEAIERLISDVSLSEMLVKQAKEVAMQRFSMKFMIDCITREISSALPDDGNGTQGALP